MMSFFSLFFFLFFFQILSTRARKNVNVNDIKVGVCIFAFDMLYLNGQQLIQENLKIRREVSNICISLQYLFFFGCRQVLVVQICNHLIHLASSRSYTNHLRKILGISSLQLL